MCALGEFLEFDMILLGYSVAVAAVSQLDSFDSS